MGRISDLYFSLFGLLVVSFLPQGSQGSKCETGWFPYEKGCYGYFPERLTWNQAEIECLSYGAESHLASILSSKEMITIANALKTFFKVKDPVWIGLYDKGGGRRRWRWIDLSAFHYTNWRRGEPNNLGGTEDCVTVCDFRGSWEWNDSNCDNTHGYLCKIIKP